MKKREEDTQPQMKKAQISPSFPLESQAFPMIFKLFKTPKCALEVCQVVFFSFSLKISNFPFLYAEKRVKLASRSPVGEPLARLQRRHAAGLPVGFVKMHWLTSGSPVGEPLASRP